MSMTRKNGLAEMEAKIAESLTTKTSKLLQALLADRSTQFIIGLNKELNKISESVVGKTGEDGLFDLQVKTYQKFLKAKTLNAQVSLLAEFRDPTLIKPKTTKPKVEKTVANSQDNTTNQSGVSND